MKIPKQYLTDKEFADLLKQEDGSPEHYIMTAVAFNPPRPGDMEPNDPFEDKSHIHLMFLNVAEVAIYKIDGKAIPILPLHTDSETYTFEDWASIHPFSDNPAVWAYHLWEKEPWIGEEGEEFNLVDKWAFRDDPISEYVAERTETH